MSFTTEIKKLIPSWITPQIIKDLHLSKEDGESLKVSKWKRLSKISHNGNIRRLFSSDLDGIYLTIECDKNDNVMSHNLYSSDYDAEEECFNFKNGITNNPKDYMFNVIPSEYDPTEVIVAVSPIKYYKETGAQWDQHIEQMDIMPAGYYEEMESTFSSPHNEQDTIKDLTSRGLTYEPNAFKH